MDIIIEGFLATRELNIENIFLRTENNVNLKKIDSNETLIKLAGITHFPSQTFDPFFEDIENEKRLVDNAIISIFFEYDNIEINPGSQFRMFIMVDNDTIWHDLLFLKRSEDNIDWELVKDKIQKWKV